MTNPSSTQSDPTIHDRLMAASHPERVAMLTDLLREGFASELGRAVGQVSPDAPFPELNPEWATTAGSTNLIKRITEPVLGRTVHFYELRKQPIASWPTLGTIREVAEHLANEVELPAPTRRFTDPYEGGRWAWILPDPTPLETKLGPAAFVLCVPRSGSTLFRFILDRNPALLSGPELYLLAFNSVADRRDQTRELGYAWMNHGHAGIIADATGIPFQEAAQERNRMAESGVSSVEAYQHLLELAGDRLLVDKSPPYTAHPAWMARAEALFDRPKYVLLARHPMPTIESFVRMRFHWLLNNHWGVWDDNPWLYGEKWWAVGYRNALDYLRGIAADRQHWITYEDLVREPEPTLRGVCDFLGVPYDPAMLFPYEDATPHTQLGDPNLYTHTSIDPTQADKWRRNPPPQELSEFTLQVAAELGYEV